MIGSHSLLGVNDWGHWLLGVNGWGVIDTYSYDIGGTGHGLPLLDSSSGGASVLRILSPPGDSVLGQKLLPQGESSPCTGTDIHGMPVLGHFLRRSTCI